MLVIPINSSLYNLLKEISRSKRMVFMAGLLGTGKTLMIQQLALLAHEAGRSVHFLQYDIARQAFETKKISTNTRKSLVSLTPPSAKPSAHG